MIIELYGLPGSGKTTLAAKISQDFGFKIIKIRKKSELVFYNFLFLIKHPIKFFVLLFFVAFYSKKAKVFYYKLMNAFFDYNAKYQKALRYGKAVLDQGYFQNIISVFDKELPEKFIANYIKYILPPDLLVAFDLPAEASMERARSRGVYPRSSFGKAYLKKWQDAMAANDQKLKKIMSGAARPREFLLYRGDYAEIARLLEK